MCLIKFTVYTWLLSTPTLIIVMLALHFMG